MRAARTDKGVHALGQVISAKLVYGDDLDSFKQRINQHLPDPIRIFGLITLYFILFYFIILLFYFILFYLLLFYL